MLPVCKSSILATATISPGPGLVDRLGLVGLHLEQLGDLHALAHADHRNRRVLLQRAGEDADEAQLLHERVDAGLEDLGDQRAGGVGLDLDLLRPSAFVALRTIVSGGRQHSGHRVQQFGEADARLARHADDRDQAPLGDRLRSSAGASSSSVGGLPSK